VLDVGSIRDFDVAHTGDTLLALVPDPFFTAAASSVMVDWRSLVK
jgi:hypothetical protein